MHELERPQNSPDDTDLERRVLAHERVLQTLIAYMSGSEPRFIEHLQKVFVEPMTMERHEQDYRGSDDYVEEFIRAIMVGGIGPASPVAAVRPRELKRAGEETGTVPDAGGSGNRVVVTERNGIWCVKVGDEFHGEFVQKEHALAEAALLKLAFGR